MAKRKMPRPQTKRAASKAPAKRPPKTAPRKAAAGPDAVSDKRAAKREAILAAALDEFSQNGIRFLGQERRCFAFGKAPNQVFRFGFIQGA